MAERSTMFKALNGGIAEKAEGALGRYDELSAISPCVGVICFTQGTGTLQQQKGATLRQ